MRDTNSSDSPLVGRAGTGKSTVALSRLHEASDEDGLEFVDPAGNGT